MVTWCDPATEQSGVQDKWVPYRHIFGVQFNINYYRQTIILMGPSALEYFKAYEYSDKLFYMSMEKDLWNGL